MLKPVERPREHRPPLVPDNLLMMLEADPQKAVQHLAREHRCMPDVSDLETRDQFERLRPVGARVAGDRGFGVPLGALLHVAGLGRAASVQAGSIAPLGIKLNTVWRVRHQQLRFFQLSQPGRLHQRRYLLQRLRGRH